MSMGQLYLRDQLLISVPLLHKMPCGNASDGRRRIAMRYCFEVAGMPMLWVDLAVRCSCHVHKARILGNVFCD